jgi:hypothetical protein
MWYQYLNRKQPYMKNFRKWNLWYDHNNPRHFEILRQRATFFEHILRRICKHDVNMRAFFGFVLFPFFAFLWKQKKRFTKQNNDELSVTSAQLIANTGRNKYGFESRGTKSFEHSLGILISKNVLSHTLEGGSNPFMSEEMIDEDAGLEADFNAEDLLNMHKEDKHEPHVGIVFRHPHKHYLNDSPNDYLSPYKVVGETVPEPGHHHAHDKPHGQGKHHH